MCIIVSPLGKPRCFWGKQWLLCLNKKEKKKKRKKNVFLRNFMGSLDKLDLLYFKLTLINYLILVEENNRMLFWLNNTIFFN